MNPLEKLSVPVAFSAQSDKSLEYVLALARGVGAQLVVLQVIERGVEKYSLIFSVALLESRPFSGGSIAAVPVAALQGEKRVDLVGIVERVVKEKGQIGIQSSWFADAPFKILAASFQDDQTDMVIFEFGERLPFPQRAAVELLKVIEKLPYPVLLTKPRATDRREAQAPPALVKPAAGKNPPRKPLWMEGASSHQRQAS
jgi:hypothetical protein